MCAETHLREKTRFEGFRALCVCMIKNLYRRITFESSNTSQGFLNIDSSTDSILCGTKRKIDHVDWYLYVHQFFSF